ncbi:MAG: formimidoylglutamate deiminase [Gammaproteobacteria bacterium]|nr:formimidoylglutamate deiminase [Gammaproteobacteria bacterium]
MRESLVFQHVLTPAGLAARQRIRIGADGLIVVIEAAGDAEADGYLAVPGMPNAHSHCFQRAMAGYGEAASGKDSFWTWRETMYALARRITPDDLYAIACQAYADMLRGGFTSVGEFHYLHHLPDGERSPAMAEAVIAAARYTGIRLIMLPVLYMRGGFGHEPLPGQRRFVHSSVAEFCELLGAVRETGTPCGVAPHSLRAVPAETLAELVGRARAMLGPECPVHMHVAEQTKEVEECLVAHGTTPLRLLVDSVDLDGHWNLVHATHADEQELRLIRQSGARVVICPLTEAYLGDGVFPAGAFLSAGGQVAIGSDSNARIDALEELRLLEYGQRLTLRKRACLADADGIGIPMWAHIAAAGAEALHEPVGSLAAGKRADIVVFDAMESPLRGPAPQRAMDALLTGGSARNIRDVYVGGERRVADGRTVAADVIGERFAAAVDRLLRSRPEG